MQPNYSELVDHKIEKIESKVIRNRYPHLVGKNAKRPEHGYGTQFIIHKIITNQGAEGWGIHYQDEQINQNLILGCHIPDQQDLLGLRLSDIFDPKIGVISDRAMYLDFALHDLVANILKIPVYQMLGSTALPSIPCYDAMIYMDDISPGKVDKGIEVVIDRCQQNFALGYRAFKIKIGRGNKWMDDKAGLKRDIEITRTIREKFPDCDLLVDANDGYTIDGFLQYFDSVADCNLFWIEEPFKENREDLLRLKERLMKLSSNTLIADGETEPNMVQLFELAEEKLMDVFLMDIVEYGFTHWRKLMPILIERQILASPHNWGLKIKSIYSAHLAAGLGNVNTIEGILDETEGVNSRGYKLDEGKMIIPDQHGFGMELIWGKELSDDV